MNTHARSWRRHALVSIVSAAFFLVISARDRAAALSTSGSDAAARLARIENGLIPASTVKGRPLPVAKLADRMRHFHVPGLSAAFIDHGTIVWARAYGFADVEAHRRATTNTLFQAASISKPVTAMAAMRLVQEGKLQLDGDVNQWLGTWKVPENQYTRDQKVTPRRILSHTAGLSGHGFAGYVAGQPLPTLEQILDGEKPANSDPIRVEATPGTAMRYSGGGYAVLRALLSDVTHSSFPELMERLVLKPAGMTHSTFLQPLPDSLATSAATAYQADGKPFEGRFHVYPEMAPDGLWTTASDLARFAIEVQNEYAGTSSTILSQATMKEMLTPEMMQHDLAFFTEAPGMRPFFEHSGSNFGFFCDLFAYKASGGQGLVVMTNGNNYRLMYEYIRAVAREYGWPEFTPHEFVSMEVAPATLANYAGTYQAPDIGSIRIEYRGRRLFLHANGMRIDSEQMLPESQERFFISTDTVPFVFERDATGKVIGLIIQYPNGPIEAKKVS